MIPLRPLGLGDILRAVVAVIRQYGKVLYRQLLGVTVGALLVVPAYAVFADAALSGIIEDARRDPFYTATGGQVAALISVAAAGYLLLFGFLLAVQVIATATGTKLVRHAVLGLPVTARQLAAEARPYLWRVFGSFLLLALAVAALLLVGLLPAAIAGLAGAGPFSLLLLPVAAIALGAGMYAQVRLVLQMPVLILEDVRPTAALRRAWRLNEGAWWRSLGIPYLVNLIGSAAAQILMAPFFFLGFVLMFALGGTGADGAWEPSAGSMIGLSASLIAGLLVAGVVGAPLTPVTNALLYVDRRIRRESLDVALAQAAGFQPVPAQPARSVPDQPVPAQPAQPVPDRPVPDDTERSGPAVPAQDQDQGPGPGHAVPAAERPDPEATGPAQA
ncbi:hypothetical protein OG689_31440 [Kitasatospora sp. NBC_00240]|uniref:hypothetical protein n=1 Tax=Kitasatospora sp. NBC_00240 TaxID=2903567 RepID=UPI00224EF2E1|nr:hypothetical protein [Kitasatospora sp. NBC_00240]MCX5213732.1 hypothetical protein [Kitasatospora sp. NBC_00240]